MDTPNDRSVAKFPHHHNDGRAAASSLRRVFPVIPAAVPRSWVTTRPAVLLTGPRRCFCPTYSSFRKHEVGLENPEYLPAQNSFYLLGIFLIFLSLFIRVHGAEIPTVTRLGNGPIITQNMDNRMGGNVQGPSLIKVPEWVKNPLGKYYLYFADHRGTYIRLAYADDLSGPWSIHESGSLQLKNSFFPTSVPKELENSPFAYAHIASPDVHVREELQEFVMYLHGWDLLGGAGTQFTRLATSKDGIHFEGRPEVLGRPYFRVTKHRNYYYAMAMPGYLYRSKDGKSGFEPGPRFFNDNMRHNALLVRNNTLYVFWTQVGDAPERIFLSTIEMKGDWSTWQTSDPTELLRPERKWEGADWEIKPSERGYVGERVNQLRDPAIFEENGEIFLLYSVAGESGIAIAKLDF
ncbi:MAG: hypothetical protein O3C43_08285 [Verrucomicrobia bacterium]|nr:hypothetical protein [Verrucomicrobiota bacterium]MDA1066486.1 hypothetical protein [Verrucomicrobiota bacterium]